MLTLNESHKHNLSQLDKMLSNIYNNGENNTIFVEVFKKDSDPELSKILHILFPHDQDPQLQALKYLIEERLVVQIGNNYSLTFKGILKIHSNTFVREYENSIELDSLIRRDLLWKFRYNIIALILSGLAIIISLLTAYLKYKCQQS